MKFLKVGRVAIITRGRYAGKKVVIIQPLDTGSKSHPFPHALVAGIERYPSSVTRRMSKARQAKRSKVKPFIKTINYNHLMPTRYTLELEGLKGVVTNDTFKEVSQREDAKKTVKKALEERYTSGKNSIICVPAIGADARTTWADPSDDGIGWLGELGTKLPFVNLLLYDHLTVQERSLKVADAKDAAYKSTTLAFAKAEAALASYTVDDYANRFLAQVDEHRRSLQWKMPERLRRSFSLQNPKRELLNYRFAHAAIGVKISSYVEKQDTKLEVLSTIESGGESVVEVNQCVVDNRSAKLGNADVAVDEEEVIDLNTTHTGSARFTKEKTLRDLYIDSIVFFLESSSAKERAAYDDLNSRIQQDLKVDVHQFYQPGGRGQSAPTKILTGHPSLKDFFDFGPEECLRRRLLTGKRGHSLANGVPNPAIKVRHPSEPENPVIKIAPPSSADRDNASIGLEKNYGSSLTAPTSQIPESIHTRRPSLTSDTRRASLTVEDIPVRQPRAVKFTDDPVHESWEADTEPDAVQYKDSESIRRPQRSFTFQLPSDTSSLFKWIHIPWNHTGWVPHVLTRISREKSNLDLHTILLSDQMWLSQHNRSRHASPHARFVGASAKCLLPEGINHSHLDGAATPKSATDGVQLVVYMPYLHWDSYKRLQDRASVIQNRRNETRARPVNQEIADGKSMESKLIWQYLESNLPLHCRRTLDQFGYPSLRNTAVRDADQVLYKRTKADKDPQPLRETLMKHSKHVNKLLPAHPASDGAAKVLMVDQLWLWVLDNETAITFASPKEKEEHDGGLWKQADLVGNIYQDINGDFARRCTDPFDFAALAVFHAVKALLDHTSDLNLQVFRIFEEYISILTEQQTRSFKEFRRYTKEVAMDRSPTVFDNSNDLDALLELRDIEDELKTLDKLFEEQQRGVMEMGSQYAELNKTHNMGLNGTTFLREVTHSLNGYRKQIERMLKSAQTAQQACKELLDMKQKQANIDEAHLARQQTEVAADQSRSIMIFTVFTIIFLPLSFFASVFGINAREWSGTSTNLSLHAIFLYMGTISLAVIIVALLVAFNKFTRRIVRDAWKKSAGPASKAYWKMRRRPPPADQRPRSYNPSSELEKLVAIEASREQKRLSSVSRTYSVMNWDEEMGPRGCA
ncbi:MAG: hypothetical protein Q9191_004855 [Dirinaria sp. TL-2023a]